MKKALIVIIILIILVFAYLGIIALKEDLPEPLACTMDAKLCSDGSYVSRAAPECEFTSCPGEEEGILVSLPKANEKIASPLVIQGEARGFWFFEAEFLAELYDSEGILLGAAILRAEEDWMTEDFVSFKGGLSFIEPSSSSGTLKFLSANPSGLPEHQRIYEVSINY